MPTAKHLTPLLALSALTTTMSCHKSNNSSTPNATVYVAGQQIDGHVYKAVYWKNGAMLPLTNSNLASGATDIAVSGADVYVTGFRTDSLLWITKATYWKNGVAVDLTDGTSTASTGAIVISGSDVYIAGIESAHGVTNSNYIAKYWKNGVPVILSDSNNIAF